MSEPQDKVETTGGVANPATGETPATQKQSVTAPPLPEGSKFIWGTGRRKRAVARVRIRPGSGQIVINDRPANEYFTEEKDRRAIVCPLEVVNMMASWDIWARVDGGGFTGQAGAVTMGLARALSRIMPQSESALRDRGLLTRDSRMKERKKYGQKGARKRFQFSKR
jgi:small subunit ribosomal protein S9